MNDILQGRHQVLRCWASPFPFSSMLISEEQPVCQDYRLDHHSILKTAADFLWSGFLKMESK